MKKIIFVAVVAILATVNVKFALNNDEDVVSLTLTSIMALANGETTLCSICGNDVNNCNCDDYGITCDHADCWGKSCHENTYSPTCWCRANGNPYSFCV